MISDILSDALNKIEKCMQDPKTSSAYCKDVELFKEIVKVSNAMQSLRIKLDTPPKTI